MALMVHVRVMPTRRVLLVLERDDRLRFGIETVGDIHQGKSAQLRRQGPRAQRIQRDRGVGRARDLHLGATPSARAMVCVHRRVTPVAPRANQRSVERHRRRAGVHVRPSTPPGEAPPGIRILRSPPGSRSAPPQSGHADRRPLTTIEGHGRRALQRHGAGRFRRLRGIQSHRQRPH